MRARIVLATTVRSPDARRHGLQCLLLPKQSKIRSGVAGVLFTRTPTAS